MFTMRESGNLPNETPSHCLVVTCPMGPAGHMDYADRKHVEWVHFQLKWSCTQEHMDSDKHNATKDSTNLQI